MKFATAHKDVTLIVDGHKKVTVRSHRNRNKVWTTGDRQVSHTFSTVREAKSWMNNPKLKF